MARPDWADKQNGSITLGRTGRAVTPAASDLDPFAKSIVMLATGDITIVPLNNDNADTLSFTGLPAGYVIPFNVRRVTACSSTCATID